MKIALASSMSGIGGTENAAKHLASLLLGKGHTVKIFSSDGPLVADIIKNGAEWRLVDFYPKKKIHYLNLIFDLIKLLREAPIDVIHCQMARPVIPVWIACKFQHYPIRIVWHSRGLQAKTYPYVSRLFSWMKVHALANCKHEQEKLIRYGYNFKRVSYSYNPISSHLLISSKKLMIEKKNSNFVIGSISRLEKSRSVDKAILIFEQVYQKNKSTRLIIAGDGSERGYLESLVKTLNLSGVVEFLGNIKQKESFYQDIDMLINTLSLKGDNGAGIGNNIIEAAIFKKPVVSFDSCGIKEVVINSKTGFLVKIGNNKDFLEKILYIIGNPDKARHLGENLYNHIIEICSDDRIYSQTIKAYV